MPANTGQLKIFFSVGEPSGDLHGANLVRELQQQQPGVQCVGYGGPKMAAAGCELHQDLTQFAVMGFVRVFQHLFRFVALLRQASRYFREARPDAVVLIDFPGFNWWIARAAKRRGIPVFYYGVPQIWAWASWRVNKMRRLVDHALCKLPFEEAWFRERGCQATYVGHPYFDQMERQVLDRDFLRLQSEQPGRLVTLLPGSRTQEVASNLRPFLKAAEIIRERIPDARFAIASFNDRQAQMAREEAARQTVPVEVHVHRTPELIHLSQCCLACSGSVSLELLYHTKPAVILYVMSRPMYWLAQRVLIQCRYMTLVNLLAAEDRFDMRTRQPYDRHAPGAERIPYPEYPTYTDKSRQLAEHVVEWLSDSAQLQSRVEILRGLKAQLAHSGASATAATFILGQLSRKAEIRNSKYETISKSENSKLNSTRVARASGAEI